MTTITTLRHPRSAAVQRRIAELTQAIVRELLDYDPATGVLIWRHRDRKWFKSNRDWRAWNSNFAGQRAGSLKRRGYVHVVVFDKDYSAHRLIFLWMTGRWPHPEIDHRDHDHANNRWHNLREVTHQENHKNRSMPKTNTSGVVGVHQRRDGRYCVRIKADGNKRLHLGSFPTKRAAAAARLRAQKELGFALGHGRWKKDQKGSQPDA